MQCESQRTVKKILSFQWFRILELDPTSSTAGFTVYVRRIRTLRKSVGLQANVVEALFRFLCYRQFYVLSIFMGRNKMASWCTG